MFTTTQTSTYTVVDIRKTFGNFEADLRMIARRTGKLTQERVESFCHDVLIMAEGGYLNRVDITLLSASGTVLQAARYTVNAAGSSISGDRAGGNDWYDIAGSQLTVIVQYSNNWSTLDTAKKQAIANQQILSWNDTTVDTTYSHLQRSAAQGYASKGYELNKENFK
ncbi:MAG: hypothetical protein ACRYF0_14785 [Janthinobacterium lividum]